MNRRMQKKVEKNSINFRLSGIVLLLILGLIVWNPSKPIKGETLEPVQIFPATYSGEWHNAEKALSRDLGPEANFEEFNQENSAYLLEETPASPSESSESLFDLIATESAPIVEQGTATGSEEITEEPTIEEPIIEEPAEEPSSDVVEKTLEFSDFNVPGEFSLENKEIRSVQLGLSLAFQNGTPLDNNYLTGEPDQDSLIIEYEYNSSWYLLAEYRLNDSNSNATNNGYWSFPLPVFDNWQNLEKLKIKFIYRGTHGEIYLDALWLEVGYDETYKAEQLPEEQKKEQLQEEIQVQLTALKRNFKVNEDLEFTLPRIETQDLFAMVNGVVSPGVEIKQTRLVGPGQKEFTPEISLIQEGDDYKVKIKNSSDFPPGQYFLGA